MKMSTTAPIPGRKNVPQWPPRAFGEYEVVRPLGQGGMGVVFLVKRQHPEGEKHYALKTCRPDRPRVLEDLKEFLERERLALFQMEHGNVVRFIEAGEQEVAWAGPQQLTETAAGTATARNTEAPKQQIRVVTAPYIVLSFIEGTDADRLLHSFELPLDVSAACHIGCEVVKGLEHVHSHGLVHRDIKPSNILLKPNGEVVITDFGLVEVSGASDAYGTPAFLSPEQARGEKTTEASDIYSLGATLYYLLSRESIFSDIGVNEKDRLLTAHRDPVLRASPLASIRPNIPTEITSLVDALVDKSPERRPSAEEIDRTLTAFADRYRLRDLMRQKDVGFTTISDDNVPFRKIEKKSGVQRVSQYVRTNRRNIVYFAGAAMVGAFAWPLMGMRRGADEVFQQLPADKIVQGRKYDLLRTAPQRLSPIDDGRRNTHEWENGQLRVRSVGTYLMGLGKLQEGVTRFTLEVDIQPQSWLGHYGFFYGGNIAEEEDTLSCCRMKIVVPLRSPSYVLCDLCTYDFGKDDVTTEASLPRINVQLPPGNQSETIRIEIRDGRPSSFLIPVRGADGAFVPKRLQWSPEPLGDVDASGSFGLLVRGGDALFENARVQIQ